MGQRVVLGVAFAKAPGGVYTQWRESGCGRVRCRYYGCFGCWREGELSHGGIWIRGFAMYRLGHAVSARAGGVGGHVAQA